MSFRYQPLDADVIIVGAGLSGMTAALTFHEKVPSLKVLVLEAEGKSPRIYAHQAAKLRVKHIQLSQRKVTEVTSVDFFEISKPKSYLPDRVGGRAMSFPLWATKNRVVNFDFAGHWISQRQQPLMDLVEKLNIPIQSSPDKDGKIIIEYGQKVLQRQRQKGLVFGNPYHKYELISFVYEIEKLCKMAKLDPKLEIMSLEKFINQTITSPVAIAVVNYMILSHCGVPASHLTLGFYVLFCTSSQGIFYQIVPKHEQGFRGVCIEAGVQDITNKIVNVVHDGTVLKGQKVTQIETTRPTVAVKTQNHTYYCSSVIMAMPPTAAREIKFVPHLPQEKIRVMHSYVAGSLIRFIITYEKAFWKENGLSGDIFVLNAPTLERPLVCCFDMTTKDVPALSGLIITLKPSPKSILLEQLKDYLGNDVLNPADYVEKSWNTGSPMNCCRRMKDIHEMSAIVGRIYWSGTETSAEWYGSMTGAVLAGRRAAIEVLYDLRPAVLTVQDMAVIMPFKRRVAIFKSFDHIYKSYKKWYISVALGVGAAFLLYKIWRYSK